MNNSHLWNLLSNYISKLWGLVSAFVFIPIYIHFLGVESYAVIGFNALILGVISFADAGMSSAITKEFSVENSVDYKYSLLKLIERIYIYICVLISLIILFFSDIIASKWLTSNSIPFEDLSNYIKLIGVAVPIQLLSSLYFGALFGLNYQVKANLIQIIWNVLKVGFILLLFIIFNSNLYLFFFWQIFCNILYILVLRFNVINILKKKSRNLSFVLNKLPKEILNYIAGMTTVAIISSINIQVDKIIASSLFDLRLFGYYVIASTFSQIPVFLATPIANSIFPLFSKYSGVNNNKQLNNIFIKSSFLLNIILFPVFWVLILYTPEILKLWIGNSIEKDLLPQILILIKFLVAGSMFLALQLIPFYVLLSKGKTKYTIYQGFFQIIVGIPLLFFFVKKYGILGVGIPWVIINLGALIFLSSVIRKYLIELKCFFYFKNILFIPFFVTLFILFCFYFIYQVSAVAFYIEAILSVIISIIINIIIFCYFTNSKFFDIINLSKT